jgi:hypothetical protein
VVEVQVEPVDGGRVAVAHDEVAHLDGRFRPHGAQRRSRGAGRPGTGGAGRVPAQETSSGSGAAGVGSRRGGIRGMLPRARSSGTTATASAAKIAIGSW